MLATRFRILNKPEGHQLSKQETDLRAVGQSLRALLDSMVSKQWAILERPVALAHLFAEPKSDVMELRSVELESTVNAFVGMAVAAMIPNLKALYDLLVSQGRESRDTAYEFGCDCEVYAVPQRRTEEPPDPVILNILSEFGRAEVVPPTILVAYALVLYTQSRSYILVFNEVFDRTEVHLRRFWTSTAELETEQYGLGQYAKRTDLTIRDVVALCSQAEDYADDLPGVGCPRRPSLDSFLRGTLLAGDEGSGIGLRYADGRDKGYLFSTASGSRDNTVAEDMLAFGYGEAGPVLYRLASALDCLREEAGIEPQD